MERIKPYGVIYLITNKLDGKVYVGQTVDYSRRVRDYKRLKCKSQKKLYSAMSFHGIDNFSFEILCDASSVEELNKLEIFYIKEFNCLNPNFGYNLQNGGLGGLPSKSLKKECQNRIKDMFNLQKQRKRDPRR